MVNGGWGPPPPSLPLPFSKERALGTRLKPSSTLLWSETFTFPAYSPQRADHNLLHSRHFGAFRVLWGYDVIVFETRSEAPSIVSIKASRLKSRMIFAFVLVQKKNKQTNKAKFIAVWLSSIQIYSFKVFTHLLLVFSGWPRTIWWTGTGRLPWFTCKFFLFFFFSIMEELVLFSCSSWCQWLPAGPDLTFSSAARHVVTFIPLSNTRSLYRCPIHR